MANKNSKTAAATTTRRDGTTTVSGANTHIVLEFSNNLNKIKSKKKDISPYLYLGSAITLSYSVYRDKFPVFNCGNHTLSGFAIGNKYVAGSLITTMYNVDEFTDLLSYAQKEGIIKENSDIYKYHNSTSLKEFHTVMKDDLFSFNIHVLFNNEYNNDIRRIIIYDATFITNGQVMSINDLITETTTSYVATDIKEQHSIDTQTEYNPGKSGILLASQIDIKRL